MNDEADGAKFALQDIGSALVFRHTQHIQQRELVGIEEDSHFRNQLIRGRLSQLREP